MIRKEFGVTVRARTLRRWLRRIGFSWRKDRYVPYRSVSKERQEEFKSEVGKRAAQRRADGMTVFAEDEAAVQRSQNPAYGWRPDRGARAGQGKLLKGVYQDIRRDVPRRAANKDRGVDELGDVPGISGGDPQGSSRGYSWSLTTPPTTSRRRSGRTWSPPGEMSSWSFLPPYTPQLNPVETVWRDLKRRLAGRFFRSLDELKAAIIAILEREMGNRLKGYLVA